MGSSTALFSMIEATALRKLPVSQPDSLVLLDWQQRSAPTGVSLTPNSYRNGGVFSYWTFQNLRRFSRSLSQVFAVVPFSAGVVVDNYQGTISGEFVSGDYYTALQIPAALGRVIVPDDDKPDSEPVAVLAYSYWQQRFNSDPGILGKNLVLNGQAGPRDTGLLANQTVRIIGVSAAEFHGVGGAGTRSDLTIPLGPLIL